MTHVAMATEKWLLYVQLLESLLANPFRQLPTLCWFG